MSGDRFEKLLAIMARLRSPGGCPWDREQTLATLRTYLVEETYEVLDAIEREDWAELAGELGDLQLQIVFQAQIASEEGLFSIDDILDRISEKLVRRHPHVFEGDSADSAAAVVRRWEQIKAEERAAKRGGDDGLKPEGLLDRVARHQPALLEAYEIGKKAAKAGFDWTSLEDLFDKIREEMREVGEARESGSPGKLEDEVGDLLFMAVNAARYLRVNPELALRRTNAKFRERFAFVERELERQGKDIGAASLEEMEELWQRAKRS